MPEHDDPTAILKDYVNTVVQRFLNSLKENGHNNPRGFKYIIEAHNNEDPSRTKTKYSFNGTTILGKVDNSICIR